MTKQPKLLPCPFCGHEFTQKEVNEHYDCAFVECSDCSAQGPFIIGTKIYGIDNWPTGVIEAWNVRARPKIEDKSKV